MVCRSRHQLCLLARGVLDLNRFPPILPAPLLCHTFGIPIVASSVLLAPAALVIPVLRWPAAALFVAGWSLQLIGHAYERKRPEFFKDWRFLCVGLRWWLHKVVYRERERPVS